MDDVDAVVVGSGSFGASITYHLSKLGQRVALLDQHDLVSQTSPRAAGLTAQLQGNPTMGYLIRRSVEKIVNLTEETGQPLNFHQSGSLTLARAERLAARVRDDIDRTQKVGLRTKLVSASEAKELAPFLEPGAACAIAYTPGDVFLEPKDLPLAYVRAAESLGARLLSHTRVTGFGLHNGSVDRVHTEKGDIRTPVVIDAAGAWTAKLAETAGLRAPLVPTRHQLYITAPIAGITPEHPIVRVLEANVYVRPERGGLMVGGYEPDPVQVDMNELPPNFSMSELPLDPTPLEKLTRGVADEFPILQGAEIAELRGGLPTMTADGRFIIDSVPGVAGFFLASGCCVAGLSNSPAVGEVVADWVVNGRAPIDLSEFALARFGSIFDDNDTRLYEACHRIYANSYNG